MKKKRMLLPFLMVLFLLVGCQESLEDRAARDAKEYTRKYCPTPVINCIRTDSVCVDKATRMYTYYCTFADILDNPEVIKLNRAKITQIFTASIRESTNMKPYVQAGFRFQYVCRSQKSPKVILLQMKL